MASIDTYTIIGITIVISVVFFSLGVLVTTCICCMAKTRFKVTLHHPDPAMEPSVCEMTETNGKEIKTIDLEVNSAYGATKYKGGSSEGLLGVLTPPSMIDNECY